MVVVRRLWAIVGYGPMVGVVGPMIVGFNFRCGSWSDSRGSWSDGPMVESGGGDGPMVGYFGPMVVVLVLVGHGSSIY